MYIHNKRIERKLFLDYLRHLLFGQDHRENNGDIANNSDWSIQNHVADPTSTTSAVYRNTTTFRYYEQQLLQWLPPGRIILLACLFGMVSCFFCHICAKCRRCRRPSSLNSSTEDLVSSSDSIDQDGEEVLEYYAKSPPDYEQGVKMPVPLYVRLARQLGRSKANDNDNTSIPSASATENGSVNNGNSSLNGATSAESGTSDQLPSYEEAVALISSAGQLSENNS